ncbi:hypothetical protein NX801_15205 [Streptomyces sp. LP05-1]|uniref:Ig-like domain-containing protein n=1 Tax=Streptomyces pyxinae TaxID=2970734 RepID=A0ABT2CHU2_9ACTN|nr:hypothetical protein [Streptomyces sp. LP05-1]MCS0636984.1 hypothetical protein [Streptomyces sp. LP05-1]
MSRARRLLSVFLPLAALLAAFLLPVSSAQAAPAKAAATVVCTGGQAQHYSPPLGPLPRSTQVGISESLTCLGSPFLTGAATASFTESASCLIPPPAGTIPPADVITYHWSDGQSSTITYTLTTVVRAANQTIVTSAGTVTSGYAQGSVVEREVVTVDLDVLGCLASSVDQQNGSEVLTIVL